MKAGRPVKREAMAGALRILLVDDNLDHVQLATRALRQESTWRVDTARLGEEAIERAAEETYDLVLLDYRLPDLSGLDVLRALRAKHKALPVILMTSQGSEEVAIQALQLGASAYVVKNTDFGKRLVYEVREWLATREGA